MTIKSTEEMSKELHNWLKRDGECWHVWEYKPMANVRACQCGELQFEDTENPNFFSPATEDQGWIWFGWLVEQAAEEQLAQWIVNLYRHCEKETLSCTELAKALYEFKENNN